MASGFDIFCLDSNIAYSLVEFRSKADMLNALKTLNESTLDGRKIFLKEVCWIVLHDMAYSLFRILNYTSCLICLLNRSSLVITGRTITEGMIAEAEAGQVIDNGVTKQSGVSAEDLLNKKV